MGITLGGNSFPFDNPGDSVEGEIIEVTNTQATDMDTNEPQFWDPAKTRPKMMPTLTLAAPDGQDYTVHLSGGRYSAAKKASRRLDEGGWFKLTFTEFSDREPAKRGWNPAKLYEAQYRPPRGKGVDLDAGPPLATPVSTPATGAAANLTPQQIADLKAMGINL